MNSEHEKSLGLSITQDGRKSKKQNDRNSINLCRGEFIIQLQRLDMRFANCWMIFVLSFFKRVSRLMKRVDSGQVSIKTGRAGYRTGQTSFVTGHTGFETGRTGFVTGQTGFVTDKRGLKLVIRVLKLVIRDLKLAGWVSKPIRKPSIIFINKEND